MQINKFLVNKKKRTLKIKRIVWKHDKKVDFGYFYNVDDMFDGYYHHADGIVSICAAKLNKKDIFAVCFTKDGKLWIPVMNLCSDYCEVINLLHEFARALKLRRADCGCCFNKRDKVCLKFGRLSSLCGLILRNHQCGEHEKPKPFYECKVYEYELVRPRSAERFAQLMNEFYPVGSFVYIPDFARDFKFKVIEHDANTPGMMKVQISLYRFVAVNVEVNVKEHYVCPHEDIGDVFDLRTRAWKFEPRCEINMLADVELENEMLSIHLAPIDNSTTYQVSDGVITPINRKPIIAGAVCIGCGCDDLHACVSETGDACYWLKVNYDTKQGVCSECEKLLEADIDQLPTKVQEDKKYHVKLAGFEKDDYLVIDNREVIQASLALQKELSVGQPIYNSELRIGDKLLTLVNGEAEEVEYPIISFKEV